jgi:pimeloyl-ACP methyl ester carboxylesterase
MGGRSFRAFLPRRLRVRVRRPVEIRMGSPQYGQLILDAEPVSRALEIEAGSLVWSSDGGRLAAQELVSWPDAPITRVVVFGVEQRTRIAASPPRRGIANPVSFEPRALIYRRRHERAGDQELRLKLDGD